MDTDLEIDTVVTIEDLPPEIIVIIFDFISPIYNNDLKLVCRTWKNLAGPLLWLGGQLYLTIFAEKDYNFLARSLQIPEKVAPKFAKTIKKIYENKRLFIAQRLSKFGIQDTYSCDILLLKSLAGLATHYGYLHICKKVPFYEVIIYGSLKSGQPEILRWIMLANTTMSIKSTHYTYLALCTNRIAFNEMFDMLTDRIKHNRIKLTINYLRSYLIKFARQSTYIHSINESFKNVEHVEQWKHNMRIIIDRMIDLVELFDQYQ